MPSRPDPDGLIIEVADDDPAWRRSCPHCGAQPDDECTSLVSGCCIDGMHAPRLRDPAFDQSDR